MILLIGLKPCFIINPQVVPEHMLGAELPQVPGKQLWVVGPPIVSCKLWKSKRNQTHKSVQDKAVC